MPCNGVLTAVCVNLGLYECITPHAMKLRKPSFPSDSPDPLSLAAHKPVRIPIRLKILAFALFIVFFAVIIAIFAFIQRSVLASSVQAGELQAELLKANDSKNKFLFRRLQNDADAVDQHLTNAVTILNNFHRDDNARHLFGKTQHYRTVFQQLAEKMRERGMNENSGAEGTLRHAIHEAQNIATQYQQKSFEILLLQARRREKDFFMRRDDAYINEVRQIITQAIAINTTSNLDVALRNQLNYYLNTYLQAFEQATTLIHSMKILDDQLNSEMEHIEPLITNIVAVRQDRSAMVENIVLLVVFFCLLSSVALAFVFAYLIAEPIAELERAAEKVAKGQHDITVKVRSRDEVGNLARVFNTMTANVQQRTRDLERSYNEIASANTFIQHQKELLEEQTIATQRANLELSSLNVKLKRFNADLERANQEKNEFLGIAAHDLKNPLMGMRGLISLLQLSSDEMTKSDVEETAQILQRSIERMSTIVSNLLDINAIETGNMKLAISPFDLRAVLAETIEDYAIRADEKGITIFLENTLEDQAEPNALGDAAAVRQILDNLVSNAVKYSPSGKRIWARLLNKNDTLRVEVQDEGPGLSDDDKKKLFGKFVRLSAQPTGNEHSTGLGLSIVKRMVEAMNGRVWCEAELGRGATFIVELPVAATAEVPDFA